MLYEVFRAHPQICMSRVKETCFFDREFERGLDWYASQFQHCTHVKAIGEVSNSYFFGESVPMRIKDTVPGVKIITVLRDPVERMLSQLTYRQRRSRSIPAYMTLDEALDYDETLIESNCYARYLRRFYAVFPRQQMFVGFYQDLSDAPATFVQRLFAFLNVDASFVPDVVFAKVNKSVRTRSAFMARPAFVLARVLRGQRMFAVLSWAKRSMVVRYLLFSGDRAAKLDRAHIDDAVRMRIMKHFRPEILELEELTGRDLSAWYES